jgi:hypothetical protein
MTQQNYVFSVATDFAQIANADLPHVTCLLDSGATQHFDPHQENFTMYTTITLIPITSANGNTFYAIGHSDVPITMQWNGQPVAFTLKNTLHAPDMPLALVSVHAMTAAKMSVHFEHNGASIYAPDCQLIIKLEAKNRLYPLTGKVTATTAVSATTKPTMKMSLMDFHHCMGHTNYCGLLEMLRSGVVTGIELTDTNKKFCINCVQGQPRRNIIPKKSTGAPAEKYGNIVHSDLWGPAQNPSLGGSHYFMSLLDELSDEVKLSFMKKKSGAHQAYQGWRGWAKTHCSMIYNRELQRDQGGKYLSNEFKADLEASGTHHRLTVHNTPQQNSKAEQLNQTLVGHVQCMMTHAKLTLRLWPEAVHHAGWLRN